MVKLLLRSLLKSKNHIRCAVSRKLLILNVFESTKSEAEELIEMIEQELGNVDLNEKRNAG